MEKVVKKLTNTFTWAASSDLSPISLPREGLITEIRLRMAITMSATLVGACNSLEGLRNVVQNLKIQGEGGRHYFGMSGELMGRLLAILNNFDHQTSLISYVDGATEHITFVIHPGSNPRDPFDLTAVIPAQDLSQLQIALTTTANTVVDDTITISSGAGYLTVFEILGLPTPPGIMTPMSSTFTWPPDATYSDLSKKIDVPTGAFLRRMAILVQDETATRPVRKDDEVTELSIELPKTGKRVMDIRWEDLKQLGATYYKVPSVVPWQLADDEEANPAVPDGFGVIDFRMFADPLYGLDLRPYQTGDVKLGLTIGSRAAGDDVIIWWDQLTPHDKR